MAEVAAHGEARPLNNLNYDDFERRKKVYVILTCHVYVFGREEILSDRRDPVFHLPFSFVRY